jgi:lambda repressor-like predicted transcriptional regulator
MTDKKTLTIIETPASKPDPLTQDVANAILAFPATTGRSLIASTLGVPAAVVWAVRGAAGQLKLNAVGTAYVQARVARAGVVIGKPAAVRKPRAPRAKKAAA